MLRRPANAATVAFVLPFALAIVGAIPVAAQARSGSTEPPVAAKSAPEKTTPAAQSRPAADTQRTGSPAVATAPTAAPTPVDAAQPPATTLAPAANPAVPLAAPAATEPPKVASPATPEPPAAATPAAVEQPPAPLPVDPVVAEVRRQLGDAAKGNVDRAALAAFYAARSEPLLWVASDGFTARARHAMAEIRKADDWGLTASAFDLPHLQQGEAVPAALAGAEIKLGLAVLKYARFARGGRLDPAQISKHIDVKLTLRDPKVVLEAMAGSETPGNYLRGLHPKHEQFGRLREALLKARSGQATRAEPAARPPVADLRLPEGPALKVGSEHPQVALLRQRLSLPQPRGAENIYDLEVQEAVKAFQRQNDIQPSGILTARTRTALNGGVRSQKAAPAAPVGSEVQRLIVNMERWRWLPENLGDLNIQDNLPEFMTRVVKKGQVIHTAKIIIGKVETPTAVFSANMRTVVFHPEWGVPDSIKVKELAPYLSGGGGGFFFFGGGGDTSILDRQRMRVVYNGRPVSASSVDWGQVDIRRFTFIQSAGPHNVLGVVKFLFPNKHDIYMHDTPQRELFEQSRRMFSHGCVRVHNPGRLAELILAEDKGWPAEQVRGLLAQGYNNEVQLTREIPVYVTYFTAVAGDGGQVSYHGDIYGYDGRMAAALGGKPLPPEATPSDDQPPMREARRQRPQKQTDFFSGLFGN